MNELVLGLVLIFLQMSLIILPWKQANPIPSPRHVLKARRSIGRKWLVEALKSLCVSTKPQRAKHPENGVTRGFLGVFPVHAVKVVAGLLLAAFQLRWFLPSGI